MWHVTCEAWWGVIILSTFQLPSSYGLGKTVFWRLKEKGPHSDWMTKMFVKQPQIYRVCLIYCCLYNQVAEVEQVSPLSLQSCVSAWELRTWNVDSMFTSHYMWHVTCHVSHIMCHMSQVTFTSFLCWSYLVEGLLSIGPTLSSLFLTASYPTRVFFTLDISIPL